MGLLHTEEGRILIDGVPINEVPNYRSQISAVMQEEQLLSGDLYDNISCFESRIDVDRVYDSAKKANIDSDIQNMTMKYNTLVGEMGGNFSGGQKQRIVLARALYRQPRILFMDEATSHLDVLNETLVNEEINKLDITRILVAHRPETVKSAGRKIQLH